MSLSKQGLRSCWGVDAIEDMDIHALAVCFDCCVDQRGT